MRLIRIRNSFLSFNFMSKKTFSSASSWHFLTILRHSLPQWKTMICPIWAAAVPKGPSRTCNCIIISLPSLLYFITFPALGPRQAIQEGVHLILFTKTETKDVSKPNLSKPRKKDFTVSKPYWPILTLSVTERFKYFFLYKNKFVRSCTKYKCKLLCVWFF